MFLDAPAPRRRRGGCLWLFLIGIGCLLGVTAGSILPPAWRGWIVDRLPPALGRWGQPAPTPTPTPVPTPPPTPNPTPTPLPKQVVIPPKTREVSRLYNGIQVHSTFGAEPGRQAALERETPDSYALDIQFQIKVPTAARTAEELGRSAPDLLATLPKLGSLLDKAEVSKFYNGLYQNKTESLRQNLTRLDALLPRDTFYDTDTILEIQDPDSHRRLLLIQSDMDVDSDGSDADRLTDIDSSDPSFQPLTSYRWARRSAVPNPLLTAYRDRLAKQEAEARSATTPPRRSLQNSIETLRNEVYQLEHYSSLIARTDPYIVLPGFMARQSGHPYQPKLGDYAVVLANNRLYPAIFGDIGPSDRAGEASLRLAQMIDPRATPERSPVNDLKITYLVFPGSADAPAAPPDLGKIRQRCQALLNEIGGSKLELFDWPNLIPVPTPTPTPIPVSTVGVSPTASPALGTSATPMATISPSTNAMPKPTVASITPPVSGASVIASKQSVQNSPAPSPSASASPR